MLTYVYMGVPEYSEDKYKWYNHAYATHQPFLEAYVKATTGDILEFGTGFSSTPLLSRLLKGTDRRIFSIEDDKEWLKVVKSIVPESPTHTYHFLEPLEDGSHWENFASTFTYDRPVSILFLDQTGFDRRVATYKALKHLPEYTIFHDADALPIHSLLGKITDVSLEYSDESKYDFSEEFGSDYKLYFPPAPWTNTNRGPPTLVGTLRSLPIFPYSDIEFED